MPNLKQTPTELTVGFSFSGPYHHAGMAQIKRTASSMGGAFRVIGGANAGVYYRHGDHLGSTSVISDASGLKISGSDVKYAPFGEMRSGEPPALTDFGYTGQRLDRSTGGLMSYGARYYLPSLRRFISADTVVPGAGNPQAFNRYSYTVNNPIKYTDPTGHVFALDDEGSYYYNPYTPNGGCAGCSGKATRYAGQAQLQRRVEEARARGAELRTRAEEARARAEEARVRAEEAQARVDELQAQSNPTQSPTPAPGAFPASFPPRPGYASIWPLPQYYSDPAYSDLDMIACEALPSLFTSNCPAWTTDPFYNSAWENYVRGIPSDLQIGIIFPPVPPATYGGLPSIPGRNASGGITVTDGGLFHAVEEHYFSGRGYNAGKSYFGLDTDLVFLAEQAAPYPATASGPNFVTVVDAGQVIGYDAYVTRAPTTIYTVVTDPFGMLRTIHPGPPR